MKRTGDDWSADSMIPVEDNAQLYRFKTFYTSGNTRTGVAAPGLGTRK